MPNIHHCYCGLHASAEQINNVTDYERCSLFLVNKIKIVSQQKCEDIGKKSRPVCKVTIFLVQTTNAFRK